MKKVCTRCKEEKEFPAQFNKRNNYNPKSTKQYYKAHCKPCDISLALKWKEKNLDKFRKYQNTYHKELTRKRKSLGLCVNCKMKAAKGRFNCEKHLERNREKWRNYRNRLLATK